MSTPWTTGQGSELLAPGLRKIFYDSYRMRGEEYPMFLNTDRNSRRNYEEDLEFTGLGSAAPEKGEGDAIQYVSPIQGSTKRYTHVAYGLGFRATEESMDDDLYNVIARQSKGLGRVARNTREIICANVLNLAFTQGGTIHGVNSTDGFKAEALIATSHTSLRGVVGSNRPATDVDLSKAALEAAIIAFDDLEDEDGIPIVIIPRTLLIPSGLQMIAEELIGSSLDPESANNAINPLARRGLSYKVLHYLTDTDAWFLQGDEHDMNFIERKAISFQSGDDFDTGDAKFKYNDRFSVGHGDWRGIYGSTGA